MAPGIPNVFANIDTGKVTNNEWLDSSQSSAFDALGFTRKQRLYGFFGCLIAGFLISLLGSIMFFFGQVTTFALLYTIGVIVSLIGTGFLIGFGKQLTMMFKPVRLVAAVTFLGSMVMVFVSAFILEIDILVLVFAVTTYLSYLWYSLSYIPYARTAVSKLVGSAV